MKKLVVILVVVSCVVLAYVINGFYIIEHVKTENNKYLITKESNLYQCLEENKETFEKIVDIVRMDDSGIHDYYLTSSEFKQSLDDNTKRYVKSIAENENIWLELRKKCNMILVRVDPKRRTIQFFQILHKKDSYYDKEGYINLVLNCNIENDEVYKWTVKNETNSKRFIIKLYNLIYN